MEFNNIRNVDALLEKEDRKDKIANYLTDMFTQYLVQAYEAAEDLNSINKEFFNYYVNTVSETIKPDVDHVLEDYITRELDRINTTIGSIRKVLDFLEGALKNPKMTPVVEQAVEGAGLQSKPEEETSEKESKPIPAGGGGSFGGAGASGTW